MALQEQGECLYLVLVAVIHRELCPACCLSCKIYKKAWYHLTEYGIK